MKKKVKIFLAGLILVIAVASGLWISLTPQEVATEILQEGIFRQQFTEQGTVLPRLSQVLNAQASGMVTTLPYKVGMAVAAGETVVAIAGAGQTEAELQLTQLRQQLSAARQEYLSLYGPQGGAAIRLETAQKEHEAALWAYESAIKVNEAIPGTYTDTEINNLQNLFQAARQSLSLAENENSAGTKAFHQEQIAYWEEQIVTLEENIRILPVDAPFAGVLWETYVEEGAYVTKYQPVAKLYRPDEMLVEASLLTEDAMLLKPGDKVTCTLADKTAIAGEVRYVSPVAEKTHSVIGIEENRNMVEIVADKLPAEVGAGQQAEIIFTVLLAEQSLTAPLSALVPLENGGDGVYLIQEGKAVLTPIETGRKAGGRVEILNGAAAGDVLILQPYDSGIKAGQAVVATP